MKNMKYIGSIVLSVLFLTLASCEGMNDIIEEYLDRGEINYIGSPDSVTCYGGRGRINLQWKVGKDVRIEQCKILWNMRTDSIIYPIDRSKLANGFVSLELPMEEGQYVFDLIQMGTNGDPSVPVEIVGNSYGEKYQSTLIPRTVRSVTVENTLATLTLGSTESSEYSEVTYVNNEDEVITIRVEPNESSLLIEDYVYGGEITVKTYYKPEVNSIDIFELEAKGRFPTFFALSKDDWENDYHSNYLDLDRSSWTIEASTEELNGETPPNGPVSNLLDGDPNTFWHSKWQGGGPALPHRIDIDMQEVKNLTSVEVARRINSNYVKKVLFYTSTDGVDWTESGNLDFPDDSAVNARIVVFPEPVKGRYFRLVITESYNSYHANLSEIMFTTTK